VASHNSRFKSDNPGRSVILFFDRIVIGSSLSSKGNLLMELPQTPPEPTRLQHTVVFLCILAWVIMLFYLSRDIT
jgi:hypothetical protein